MKKTNIRFPFTSVKLIVYGSEADQSVMNDLDVLNGYYEPHIMTTISRLLKKDSVCFDIGANIGTITLALSLICPYGKIYSFEASKSNFAFLKLNINKNRLKNIELVNKAISDDNGTIAFSYVDRFAGGSFFSTTGVQDGSTEIVDSIRLDDWVKENKIDRVDFIKLDVEGSEIKAIDGAVNVLSILKPDMIVEVNPTTLSRFFNVTIDNMYLRLQDLYPFIYLINIKDISLIKINSLNHIKDLISLGRGVEDLLCSCRELI